MEMSAFDIILCSAIVVCVLGFLALVLSAIRQSQAMKAQAQFEKDQAAMVPKIVGVVAPRHRVVAYGPDGLPVRDSDFLREVRHGIQVKE